MDNFIVKFQQALNRLSGRQKVQLALAVVATLGLVWGFTVFASKVRYGVLFSHLSQDDAAQIMTALKERQIEYRVAAGGTLIEVPVEKIDEVRLELAGEGLPPGGGAGFELFDKPAFGLSDFVQNVNYRRALERELARTIQSLDGVDSARVHLALPPETVFVDEQRPPTASVVLRMRSGRSLPAGSVRAVANLVASGVEGLDPKQVSVIDGEGRMLSTPGEDPDNTMSASQMEAKQSVEKNIETTLMTMLEPLVGIGKARARATVELNMTRTERVQEVYDPDGAVIRSEQKSKTSSEEGGGTGGIPGTASNLPGAASPAATNASGKQQSQDSLTNFELSKTVSTITEPVGNLLRQSVAVVVDHALVESTTDGGAVEFVPTPRTDEEMQRIIALIEAAIGYDQSRGDQLIVQNIQFEVPPPLEEGGTLALDTVFRIMRYLALPLAVLLLAMFVIRPALASLRSLKSTDETGGGLPPTVAQLQTQVQTQLAGGQLPALGDGGSPLRRKLMEAVGEDPQAAALVIRNWLDRRKSKE